VIWTVAAAIAKGAWGFLRAIPWQVWLVVAVLAAGWLYGEHTRAEGEAKVQAKWDQREVEVAAEIGKWRQANEDNQRAIATLTEANHAWAGVADATRAKADKAAAAVEAQREQFARDLEQARRDRGAIYAKDPDAAAWGRARVPARIADQLRQ
jgi:hypothetical protein